MRARVLFLTSFAALLGGCFRSDFPTACSENETQCEDVVLDSGTSETSAADTSADSLAIDSTTDSGSIDSAVAADSGSGDATAVDSRGMDSFTEIGMNADDASFGDGDAADSATSDDTRDAPPAGDATDAATDANDVGTDGGGDVAPEVGCDAAACTSPPPKTCANPATKRTFAAGGTCTDGTCSYASTDTPCSATTTCSAGECVPRSCTGSLRCNGESCCTTILVPGTGGNFSFKRSYDGVTANFSDPQFVTQVADFRLDKFEITVGRFRNFVDAVVAGWTPAAGSGKHTYLPEGGLSGPETGWDVAWNSNLPTSKSTWDGTSYLGCSAATWTSASGANENKPINCIRWFHAAAFCIWDGGFLPSEAEWNYAAAGGTDQRIYPWGSTAPAPNLAVYGCLYNGTGTCNGATSIAPVGSTPDGNGRWGHADLAGSMWEWTQDWYASPYGATVCNNCFWSTTTAEGWVVRGGSYFHTADVLYTSHRGYQSTSRIYVGARCARMP